MLFKICTNIEGSHAFLQPIDIFVWHKARTMKTQHSVSDESTALSGTLPYWNKLTFSKRLHHYIYGNISSSSLVFQLHLLLASSPQITEYKAQGIELWSIVKHGKTCWYNPLICLNGPNNQFTKKCAVSIH